MRMSRYISGGDLAQIEKDLEEFVAKLNEIKGEYDATFVLSVDSCSFTVENNINKHYERDDEDGYW